MRQRNDNSLSRLACFIGSIFCSVFAYNGIHDKSFHISPGKKDHVQYVVGQASDPDVYWTIIIFMSLMAVALFFCALFAKGESNASPIKHQTTPPSLPSAVQADNSFPKKAALFSLLAPFIAIGIDIFGRQAMQGNRVVMIILGDMCALIIFSGFISGIVALIDVKKRGNQGILGKALAGVCINGVVVFFILITMLNRAQPQQ